MTPGLILFAGRLVGECVQVRRISSSDVQPQQPPFPRRSAQDRLPLVPPEDGDKLPLAERRLLTAPERMFLPRVTVPKMPHTARERRGMRGMAATTSNGFQAMQSSFCASSKEGHTAATSSARGFGPKSSWNSSLASEQPSHFLTQIDSPPRGTTIRRAHASNGFARPGTEERHSGLVAALDPSVLPALFSGIIRDDVRYASDSLGEAEWLAAEHRSKCYAEAKEKDRKKAILWKKQQLQRCRKLEEEAREHEAMREREREEEAVALAKLEADDRWRKAFTRMHTKDIIKRGAIAINGTEGDAQERHSLGLNAIVEAHLKAQSQERTHLKPLYKGKTRLLGDKDSDEDSQSDGHSAPSVQFEDVDAPPPSAPRHDGGRRRSSLRPLTTFELHTEDDHNEVKSLLQWKLKKEPLDDRIQYLRRLQKLRNRSTRYAQQYEARMTRYYRLSEPERKVCEAAYLQLGPDPCLRTLDMSGVRECLYEVGARGISLEEQLEVVKVCSEAQKNAAKLAKGLDAEGSNALNEMRQEVRMACLRGGINLYTFATGILPQARKHLEHTRQRKVEDWFREHDHKGEGLISLESCTDIIRGLSGNEKLTLDTVRQHAGVVLPQSKLKEADKELKQAANYKPLKLHQTQQLVLHYCVEAEVHACAQERKIQKEFGIHRDTFKQLRADLIALHSLYTKMVGDKRRPLSKAECDRLFHEFGMQGVKVSQHVGESGIDFVDLLSILDQIRADVESDAFDELSVPFEYFPKVHPNSKMLAVTDVEEFLSSVGLKPATPDEQAALCRALEDALAMSTNDDDMLEFQQVKRVLQRRREIVRRMHHHEEVQAAIANGFREDELEELRETFQVLDADHSGTIEPDEAWGAVKTLGFQISKAEFSKVYGQVDDDGSGSLEFIEFLTLLHLIRDREGCFATNRHVQKLNDLLKPELLNLLTLFHECSDEVEALGHPELLMRVCFCFELEPHDPVHKRLNAKTFQDLCNSATALFEKRMNGS